MSWHNSQAIHFKSILIALLVIVASGHCATKAFARQLSLLPNDGNEYHHTPTKPHQNYVQVTRYLDQKDQVRRKIRNSYSLFLIGTIMDILLEQGPMIRSRLAGLANINYARLSSQLEWLEAMNYIEYRDKDNRTLVKLTRSGTRFASDLTRFMST